MSQDTNGDQDVYEWERAGLGTCREPKGCVYLISSNLSSEEAAFLDASATGSDVFFTTRAQLVTQDRNEAVDLYDARECTSASPCLHETATACTNTGCQGVPPVPPAFASPSSLTFNGTGNFEPLRPAKAKTAAQIRAEHLAKALKQCKKKPRHRRATCERQARRRYGPPKSHSRSKSPRGGK